MTLPLLHLTLGLVGAVGFGYLLGRRAYRKKLQTTDGRLRAGIARAPVQVEPSTDFAPTMAPPTTLIRLVTEPQSTVTLPRQR